MMGNYERLRAFVPLLGAALLGVAIASAIAGVKLTGAAPAAGQSIYAMQTTSSSTWFTTASETYVDVPGAAGNISVPRNSTAFVVLRFAASSVCDMALGGSCLVRARINADDASQGEVVWMRTPTYGALDGPGARAMDWSTGPLPPGSYAIQVQARIDRGSGAGGSFGATSWHLTIEGVKTS